MNFPESLFYSFLKYNKYPLFKKTHISVISSNSENIVQLLLVSTKEREQVRGLLGGCSLEWTRNGNWSCQLEIHGLPVQGPFPFPVLLHPPCKGIWLVGSAVRAPVMLSKGA